MKALLLYVASKQFWPRLLRTIAFQDRYFPGVLEGVSRVVVVDREDGGVPDTTLRVVRADTRVNGLFNLARAKNVAFDIARDEGYDWLVDADADRVLTSFHPQPSAPFSHALVYWAAAQDSDAFLARTRDLSCGNGSFFVLGREVFTRVRMCEEYRICRWDDFDFAFNVCPAAGFHQIGQAGTGIHLWHPDSERCYDREPYNSALFRKRQEEMNLKEGR